MATQTPNLNLTLPGVNDPTDENIWGDQLNANFTTLDTIVNTALDKSPETTVASATTTDLSATASNVYITGTNGITSFGTAPAGISRRIRFAAALVLTHSANLILPNAVNYTTAANISIEAFSLGSGVWVVRYVTVPQITIPAPVYIQQVYDQNASFLTLSNPIPYNDSVPQITNGTLILQASITPTSATNYLLFQISASMGGQGGRASIALFNNASPAALASAASSSANTDTMSQAVLQYRMLAGSTSALTFSVRAGDQAVGGSVCYLNGRAAGRIFGGSQVASITITEIKA